MRKIFSLIAVFLLLATTTAFAENYIIKPKGIVQNTNSKVIRNEIPDEIYNVIKSKFPYVKSKNEVSYIHTRINPSGEGEFIAFSAVDRLNGFFIMFVKRGQQYETVYVKEKPVYSVEVTTFNPQVIFVDGSGGTGVQENKIHVIRYTPKGYMEVWSGTATSIKFVNPPYISIDGSIGFSTIDGDELIYFQLKRIYDQKDNKLVLVEKENTVHIFRYNEQTLRYGAMTGR